MQLIILRKAVPVIVSTMSASPLLVLAGVALFRQQPHIIKAWTWSCNRQNLASSLPFSSRRRSSRRGSSSIRSTTSTSCVSYVPNEKERQMHKDAREILSAGIAAVDPAVALNACVRIIPPSTLAVQNRLFYDAKDYDHVSIISFGKASVPMAIQVCELVHQAFFTHTNTSSSSRDTTTAIPMDGIVITKDLHASEEERRTLQGRYNVHVRSAGHPVPDERSVQAAMEVMELITRRRGDRTLFLCCISGGGSALLTLPILGTLTLKDIQITSEYMLQSGMPIQKMNILRKRLDGIKGGRLAAAAYPSTMCTFVLSDVIGDSLTSIASGPTVPDDDDQTLQDVRQILKEYGILNNLPHHIYQLLHGTQQHIMETPKSNHPMFQSQKCNTILIGNNQVAVLASAARAEQIGYSSVVLGTCIEGEAKEVANVYAAMATYPLSLRQHPCPASTGKNTTATTTTTIHTIGNGSEQPEMSQYYLIRNQFPVALIAGGETTVTISHGTNVGRGGRNQELGLAVALILQQKKLRNIVFASVGTDGTDGPTDAAGVVVDGGTIARIEHQQQQHLRNTQVLLTGTQALHTHDSYTFFSYEQESHTRASDTNYPALIKTGPTGTNVADIAVILIH